jgi:hypothetical protein
MKKLNWFGAVAVLALIAMPLHAYAQCDYESILDDFVNGDAGDGDVEGWTWNLGDTTVDTAVTLGEFVTITAPVDEFGDAVFLARASDCSTLADSTDPSWWQIWDRDSGTFTLPAAIGEDQSNADWRADGVTEGYEGLFAVLDWDNEILYAFVLSLGPPPEPADPTNQGPTEVPVGMPVSGVAGLALLIIAGASGGALAIRRTRR